MNIFKKATTKTKQKHKTDKFVLIHKTSLNKKKQSRTDRLILIQMCFFYYRYVQPS
jgi:hypothetical protein